MTSDTPELSSSVPAAGSNELRFSIFAGDQIRRYDRLKSPQSPWSKSVARAHTLVFHSGCISLLDVFILACWGFYFTSYFHVSLNL